MSSRCYPPAPGLQAKSDEAHSLTRGGAHALDNLPTGPPPTEPAAGASVGQGRSSALPLLDLWGQSDPTTVGCGLAPTSAAQTVDAAMQAASVDYSHCHQAQRLMPAESHRPGAVNVLFNTAGGAAGRGERPLAAAISGTNYGLVPNSMEIDPRHVTPAEANPPSVSELRIATPQSGPTSDVPCIC
jgi:hypothetical protein